MTARLFLAIPIPEQITNALEQAMQHYPQYVEKMVPKENRHLTLLWLGEVKNYAWYLRRLSGKMPQHFLPAITLTHVGRGLRREQLWAYAHETNVLKNVRRQVRRRVIKLRIPKMQTSKMEKELFVPHVRLANLHPASRGIGLADYPVGVTFTAKQIVIYSSELKKEGAKYTSEGIISLVP
ncbi:MAG: RNA 2',3'-cyclic phosphodiesterase [bacterium]